MRYENYFFTFPHPPCLNLRLLLRFRLVDRLHLLQGALHLHFPLHVQELLHTGHFLFPPLIDFLSVLNFAIII